MAILRRDAIKTIETTTEALHFALSNRSDVITTTSFGYQSALLFYLLDAAGIKHGCLYVSSNLASGGQAKLQDELDALFGVNVTEVSRSDWVKEQLTGRDFLDVPEKEREALCSDLKKAPLKNFICEQGAGVWVTGIRRDQTKARQRAMFMSATDLGVVKVAPMFAWSKEDTRLILKACGLPVNNEYVDMCKLNSSLERGLHV